MSTSTIVHHHSPNAKELLLLNMVLSLLGIMSSAECFQLVSTIAHG